MKDMVIILYRFTSNMFPTFHPGPPIVYGIGSFGSISSWLPEGDVFLVLGGRSDRRRAIEDLVKEETEQEVTVFYDVEPNPSSETVERGAEALKDSRSDIILSVGGGSVIDAAKFMAVIAHQGGTVIDFLTGKKIPSGLGLPLIAVPTTPGTSSEITPFSVVTVKELNNKVGLRHPSMYPTKAVIDPGLTRTLPPEQTVTTGLDILSHSMESYWAAKATPLTREMSLAGIRYVKENLIGAYKEGDNIDHREGLTLASIFAGRSFSNTGTTICHALSYPITMDTGLHHGSACALSLGPTYDLLRKKGVNGLNELAVAFGSHPDELSKDLKDWLGEMGAPTELGRIQDKDWTTRIMNTEFSNFQSNFTVDIDDDDVIGLIRSM